LCRIEYRQIIARQEFNSWNVKRKPIFNDVHARMNPVPGKGYAVNVLPIIGEAMNCPDVFSPPGLSARMTVLSENSSRTRDNYLIFFVFLRVLRG